jgi:hypothetical protein
MITTPRPLHLLAASAAAGALLLAGCGAASEKLAEEATERAIESQGGGNVEIDTDGDGSINIETDEGTYSADGEGNFNLETGDGSFSAGSGSMPDGWPDDVPLPDDFEVITGSTMDNSEGTVLSATGTSSTPAADVVDDMKAALDDWTVSGESNSNSNGVATASAQFETDGRQLSVYATEVDGETTVNVSHTTLP